MVWDAAELIQAATFTVIGLWVLLQAWGFMRNRFSATRNNQIPDPRPAPASVPADVAVRLSDGAQPAGAYAGASHRPAP